MWLTLLLFSRRSFPGKQWIGKYRKTWKMTSTRIRNAALRQQQVEKVSSCIGRLPSPRVYHVTQPAGNKTPFPAVHQPGPGAGTCNRATTTIFPKIFPSQEVTVDEKRTKSISSPQKWAQIMMSISVPSHLLCKMPVCCWSSTLECVSMHDIERQRERERE